MIQKWRELSLSQTQWRRQTSYYPSPKRDETKLATLEYTKCCESPTGGETISAWKDPGNILGEGSIWNGSGRLDRISEVRDAEEAINSLAKHKGKEARWCLENSRWLCVARPSGGLGVQHSPRCSFPAFCSAPVSHQDTEHHAPSNKPIGLFFQAYFSSVILFYGHQSSSP